MASDDGVAGRRLVLDQLVGGIDAELRLRGAGRGTAAQPGQLLAHQVLALGLGDGGHPVALDALQDVRRVAALERFDDAVVHLPGGGADLVEEPPVVGDDDEAAGSGRPALLEVPGEPGDALDVEVVGGLVEEDDVLVADEERGERDAAALAAGEVADGRVPGDVASEAGDDVADCGSPAHSCSSMSPTMACGRRSRLSSRSSPWSSMPRVTPPRRVTRPPSGSMRPASRRSRVDLPSPLRPTTPIRSPSLSPTVTESKMTRVGIFEVQRFGSEQMCHIPQLYRHRLCARPAAHVPLRRDCKFGRYTAS